MDTQNPVDQAAPCAIAPIPCPSKGEEGVAAADKGQPGRVSWLTFITVMAVAVIGMAATAIMYTQERDQVRSEASARFNRTCDRVTAEAKSRLERPFYGLRGLRGLFLASQSVEAHEFKAFIDSRDLRGEFPALTGFGFINRVRRDDLEAFTASVRADGAPEFTVRSTGDAPVLDIVRLIEPLDANREALGQDQDCAAGTAAAIERAITTGGPVVSPVYTLVQGPSKRPAVNFLLAIYKNGTNPTTPRERRDSLVGVVYAPVVIADLLDDAFGNGSKMATVSATDSTEPGVLATLKETEPDAAAVADSGGLGAERELGIGGRTWRLTFSPTAQFVGTMNHGRSGLHAAVGLVLTALVMGVVWALGTARARAVRIANKMTASLQESKRIAEAALLEAQVLRRTVDEQSIVSVTDTTGRIVEVNDNFCRLSGYSRQELVGASHSLLNSGFHPKGFWTGIQRTIAGGMAWHGEICNRAKDGSLYWVDTVVAPFTGPDGKVQKYVSIGTDITERRENQRALLQVKGALDQTLDCIFMFRPGDFKFVYVNEGAKRQVGYSEAELLGMTPLDIKPAFTLDTFKEMVRPLIAGEAACHTFETIHRHKDGHDVDVEIGLQFVRYESGEPRFVAVVRDITNRKAAEALRQGQARVLRMALGEAPLEEVLAEACRVIESNRPACRASVLLVQNGRLRAGASPGLPAEYTSAIDGLAIGPNVGSCGRAAATGQRVITTDIAGDADWASVPGATALAAGCGLAACWSQPIFSPDGKTVVAVLAMFNRKPQSPTSDEVKLIEEMASVVAVAVERRQKDAALRSSEQQLRTIFNAEPECVKLIGPGGVLIEMNPAGLAMLEADSVEQVRRLTIAHFIDPQYHGAVESLHERVLRGETGTLAFEVVGLKGTRRCLDTHAVPMRNEAGDPVAVLAVTRDVTQQRLAEEKSRDAEAFLRSAIDSLDSHTVVLDSASRILSANRAWREFAFNNKGLGRDVLEGADYLAACDAAAPVCPEAARVAAAVRAVLAGEAEPAPIEYACHSPTERRWFLCSIRGFSRGADRFAAVSHLNITAVKESQQRLEATNAELTDARRQAEAANHTKSEFLANMSHEIRTPLTAILGFADLLADDAAAPDAMLQRARHIETIKLAGRHLLTVINDILDLSKLDADRMSIERIDTSVVGVLREVESLMRPRAHGKGVLLKVALSTPVPAVILSDPTRLRQILMNLTGNAVKFTESGSIVISVGVSEAEGTQRLVIDIEDSGAGMSQEQTARLFAAFGQADSTVTRKHGGTGLGLVISRRLANLMGGDVKLLRTEPGKDSCFRLVLPAAAASGTVKINTYDVVAQTAEARPAAQALSLSGRILLAEDGIDNQRLIALHLKRAGAVVDVAENGEDALEMLALAASAGTPYDLLLTDMQMPKMDGYTLASTLRQQGSRIAIVALTAHAMAEDRARCLAAGCDDYASKPIDRLALIRTCSIWMGKPGGVPASHAAA